MGGERDRLWEPPDNPSEPLGESFHCHLRLTRPNVSLREGPGVTNCLKNLSWGPRCRPPVLTRNVAVQGSAENPALGSPPRPLSLHRGFPRNMGVLNENFLYGVGIGGCTRAAAFECKLLQRFLEPPRSCGVNQVVRVGRWRSDVCSITSAALTRGPSVSSRNVSEMRLSSNLESQMRAFVPALSMITLHSNMQEES